MSTIKLIYDYFTPAYKAGGPTQSLSNMMATLDLPLQVITTNQDLDGTKLDVLPDQWVSVRNEGKPSGLVWYCSESRRDIETMIKEDDIVFINSIFSHHFNYASLIKGKAKRKIISPRGMLDPGSLSQKKWKKQLYLAWWKLSGLHKHVEWHATTDQERKNIEAVFGNSTKIWTVPNFPRTIELQVVKKMPGTLNMVSVAVISPMKNHLLVLEALKSLQEDITWDIYGPVKDAKYWSDCQSMMIDLPANIQVNYHGDVPPSKIPSILEGMHIAVLPSKSENFGHSIYEALTAGKPVITSHNTPWNNLGNRQSGKNVSIDNPKELSDAIRFFAKMDEQSLRQWSVLARTFALQSIDIEHICEGYKKMFQSN